MRAKEEEPRGTKRAVDESGELSRKLKRDGEEKAAKREKSGAGADPEADAVMKEI